MMIPTTHIRFYAESVHSPKLLQQWFVDVHDFDFYGAGRCNPEVPGITGEWRDVPMIYEVRWPQE